MGGGKGVAQSGVRASGGFGRQVGGTALGYGIGDAVFGAPEPINAYAAEQADPITRKVVLKEYRPPPAPIPKRRIFEDRAIYRPAVGESVASEEDAELIGQWRTVAQSVLHAKGAKMSMPAIKLPIPPD